MKSKEEIFHEHSEVYGSIECLGKNAAETAMDEFAKQEAIAFDEWKIENEWYSLNINGQKLWERGSVAGSYERRTPIELYNLYLESKKQKV